MCILWFRTCDEPPQLHDRISKAAYGFKKKTEIGAYGSGGEPEDNPLRQEALCLQMREGWVRKRKEGKDSE